MFLWSPCKIPHDAQVNCHVIECAVASAASDQCPSQCQDETTTKYTSYEVGIRWVCLRCSFLGVVRRTC